MNNKMYVLLHKSGRYFKEQNLYLGSAMLTDDIDSAAQMPLDHAENKFKCMKEQCDWKIFRAVIGLRIGEESIRHIKAARKAELEKELADLQDCPECKSHDIDLTWVTPTCGLPEYQCGHCNDCGETWNQCARD